MVHAYEDVRTAAGQGPVALELLEQLPSVATVVVPVGGGGLIVGMAAVLKVKAPHVRVIAVQPEAVIDMAQGPLGFTQHRQDAFRHRILIGDAALHPPSRRALAVTQMTQPQILHQTHHYARPAAAHVQSDRQKQFLAHRP